MVAFNYVLKRIADASGIDVRQKLQIFGRLKGEMCSELMTPSVGCIEGYSEVPDIVHESNMEVVWGQWSKLCSIIIYTTNPENANTKLL